MKRLLVVFGALGLLIAAPQAAQAGFIGNYAVANWTTNLNTGCGSVNTAGAPNSITLTSNDCGGNNLGTDFTITALATGTWSFDWVFVNSDIDSCCEQAGYLVNGVFTILADSADGSGSSGPIAVTAGDVIGFRANATDGCCGPAAFTVSNFVEPGAAGVPEPSTLVLVGGGFGLLLLFRRCSPTSR